LALSAISSTGPFQGSACEYNFTTKEVGVQEKSGIFQLQEIFRYFTLILPAKSQSRFLTSQNSLEFTN